MRRFLPDDFRYALRTNLIGLIVFACASVAFFFVSWQLMSAYNEKISSLAASSWVSSEHDIRQPYEAGNRYDLSKKGVNIPPSREDRAKNSDDKDREKSSEYYSRDCYREAYTAEQSDLCAQWANAAAVRHGNFIAVESLQLNTLIGFITAFGAFLAAVGVVFAGMASYQASRGLKMMAYGFAPVLSFSALAKGKDRVTVTVRNAGTGPASDIRVTVDGRRVDIAQDRLGPGSHTTFDLRVEGQTLLIEGRCIDLTKSDVQARYPLVLRNGVWVLDEQQQS